MNRSEGIQNNCDEGIVCFLSILISVVTHGRNIIYVFIF